MPAMRMQHEVEPLEKLLLEVGDVSDIEIFNTQVLCAVYLRPNVKTVSGLYLPDKTRDEDRFQSKIGLVIKKGPEAFVSDAKWKFEPIEVNNWVMYRPSDGWNITVNGVLCRMLDDTDIRGRVSDPDSIW